MRSFIWFLLLCGLGQPLLAQSDVHVPRNYFFPPPKSLYYFRPDLYVYRISRPHHYPRYQRYRHPGYYVPRSRLDYPVSRYYERDYSTYRSPYRRTHQAGGIYRLIVDSPPTGGVVRVNSADLIFDVKPSAAMVYIDDKLIGSAGDFSTTRDKYTLLDGEYELRIEYPGYQRYETRILVTPDRTLHLTVALESSD